MLSPQHRQWLRRARAGEPAAMEQLVRAYQHRLFGYIRDSVNDNHLAEELTQQTWLRLIERLEAFEEEKFESFLFAIAHNLVVDCFRRHERQRLEDAVPAEPVVVESAHAVVARAEISRRIAALVESLPVEQKQVVLLRYYSQLKFRQIAELLGCPLGTVLSRMHAALQRLRTMLDEEQTT